MLVPIDPIKVLKGIEAITAEMNQDEFLEAVRDGSPPLTPGVNAAEQALQDRAAIPVMDEATGDALLHLARKLLEIHQTKTGMAPRDALQQVATWAHVEAGRPI